MRADTGDRLLDAMANFIQDGGVASIGVDLFIHRMPAEIKRGLLLTNNAGGAQVDPYIPGYRRCRFRLIARGTSPSDSLSQLNEAAALLDTLYAATLDESIAVKQLTRENDPVVFPASLGSNVLEATIALTAIYALL